MEPYGLTRSVFEENAAEYLKKFPELVNGCVNAAGAAARDIELVLLTGGHSQWYFVKEMLTGRMPEICGELLPKIAENPERVIPVTRPQETVALGLVYTPLSAELKPDGKSVS